MAAGTLYVVATPIGNLQDITHRAVSVLAEVEQIAAEDTRRARTLLDHFAIRTPVLSLHEHNEERRVSGLVARLADGADVALISDAGTPLISDPGFRLVRAAADAGIEVCAVPGPSAVMAALSIAGLPTDRFCFEGFLPGKPAARRQALERLAGEPRTMVFFETGRRVEAALRECREVFGPEREAVFCRELTKRFETTLRGTLDDLCRRVAGDADQLRGEIVLLVRGAEDRPDDQRALDLARALTEFLPASQAARVAARVTGARRRALYEELESAARDAES